MGPVNFKYICPEKFGFQVQTLGKVWLGGIDLKTVAYRWCLIPSKTVGPSSRRKLKSEVIGQIRKLRWARDLTAGPQQSWAGARPSDSMPSALPPHQSFCMEMSQQVYFIYLKGRVTEGETET